MEKKANHQANIVRINEIKEHSNETYLGDGVYVGFSPIEQIVIYTSNGLDITNKVYLNEYTLYSLLKWIRDNCNIELN